MSEKFGMDGYMPGTAQQIGGHFLKDVAFIGGHKEPEPQKDKLVPLYILQFVQFVLIIFLLVMVATEAHISQTERNYIDSVRDQILTEVKNASADTNRLSPEEKAFVSEVLGQVEGEVREMRMKLETFLVGAPLFREKMVTFIPYLIGRQTHDLIDAINNQNCRQGSRPLAPDVQHYQSPPPTEPVGQAQGGHSAESS